MMHSRVRIENPMNNQIINRSLAIIVSLIFTLSIFAIVAEGSTATPAMFADVDLDTTSVFMAEGKNTVQLSHYLEGVMNSPMHLYDSHKGVLTQLARGYTEVARAYSDHAQYELGIPWANKALRLDPTLPDAHLISGWLNQRVRNTEEAFAAYEKTIELDPTNFDARLYLGIMYVGRGNPSKAIDYLNQALEVALSLEEMSMAYTHRGHAYAELEQYEQAFADFD